MPPASRWVEPALTQSPIEPDSVQWASKTGCFMRCFQRLSRVRAIGSSRVMERAMGIEPTSEAWEASILPLYDARSFQLPRLYLITPRREKP
jgi:hypothetical protein